MTTMAAPRKSYSVQDYPEHLNPFHEEDNHNKIRFWTIGKKLNRSNSITFSGIKELKNSWAFRSFMRKGKKGQITDKTANGKDEDSPIVYRRALQYSTMGTRSTVASPERYVYGGSVTPLPRSRFQERLRSTSQHEVSSLSGTPRMARSEVTGSRLSVGSTNPFDEDGPVPPVRRRKKKRAPLPPHAPPALDVSVTSDNSELHISETDDSKLSHPDVEFESEDANIDVELKIVEDEDIAQSEVIIASPNDDTKESESVKDATNEITPNAEDDEIVHRVEENPESKTEIKMKGSDSADDILSKASFSKVDIVKYRRNSSVNDDDIRLRRGNLEDYHALTNKRSKSLTNALDSTYATYDINLNDDSTPKDLNGNEEPQKVVCKFYEEPRRQSVDTVSSTEKEFMEIDKATRELEREISKLNSALNEDDDDVTQTGARLSVSDIKRRFDNKDISSPNPIPKPRRSHYEDPISPVNGNI